MRAQDEECWKGEEEREAEAARDDDLGGEEGRKHGAIEQLYRSRSGPRRLGPRSEESDGSFSPGVTFGTQSSAIKPVCKNFEKHRNIPLQQQGRGLSPSLKCMYAHNPSAARRYRLTNSSPVISRHDLSRSRVRAVVDGRRGGECGERRKEKIRRCTQGRGSARSRATIRDHLPCSAGSSPLPRFSILEVAGGGGDVRSPASLPLSNYSLTPCAIYLRAPRS